MINRWDGNVWVRTEVGGSDQAFFVSRIDADPRVFARELACPLEARLNDNGIMVRAGPTLQWLYRSPLQIHQIPDRPWEIRTNANREALNVEVQNTIATVVGADLHHPSVKGVRLFII